MIGNAYENTTTGEDSSKLNQEIRIIVPAVVAVIAILLLVIILSLVAVIVIIRRKTSSAEIAKGKNMDGKLK